MSAFEIAPPCLGLKDLHAVSLRHYGIDGTMHPLDSERDQNARIDAAAGRFVLKLVNAGEDAALISLQDAVILHLAQTFWTPQTERSAG